MILKKGLALWLVAFLIGAFCGCGEDSEGSPVSSASSPQEVMRVAVTIAPLSGLVTPLLPEGSRVDILIPPGLSPHGAELTPSAIAIAAKADLVLGIGFGLDAGALRGVPRERMMLFQDIVELAPSGTHDHADHEGGDHADHADHGHHDGHAGHAHADGDPHVWLNPALCALFVTHVA
ncbi:MAG: zinc ABC transporter substrate-binding protein, partial [Planctomycetota bacterium]